MTLSDALLFWLVKPFAEVGAGLLMLILAGVLLALTAAGVWLHLKLDARFGYSRRSKNLDHNLIRVLAGTDRYGHAGYDRGQVYAMACDKPGFNFRNHLRPEEYDAAVRRLLRRRKIYEAGFRRLALKPKARS